MNLKDKLNQYLNSYLGIERKTFKRLDSSFDSKIFMDYACETGSLINTYISENKDTDTFQTYLFKLIDERNLKDSDVYNKVNIDRRLFSKIRSNKEYHPSKETIILFGIALELSEKEIETLLEKASYSLPMNTTFDLIIRFCFKEKIYNIDTINEFLYDHNCKLLNE